MRRKIKGWPPTVSTGYKGPKAASGLHPSGYREVLLHNVQEVSEIDIETQAARIAHTVGKKKRALIIAEARKRKIKVLNAKEIKEPEEETKGTSEETEEKTSKEQELEKKEAKKPKRKHAGEKKASKKSAPAKTKGTSKAKRKSSEIKEEIEKQ